MTLDDLHQQYLDAASAVEAYVTASAADPELPLSDRLDDLERLSALNLRCCLALAKYMIARKHGVDRAVMWRLANG